MDPGKIYELLILYNLQRIQKLIEKDEIAANFQDRDQIHLKFFIKFKYFLKTCKLIFIIMSFSYFLGVIWYIYSFEIFHHKEEELE